ncbi:MAG: hypothetical protein KDJ65_38010 [Anaerolineae bacterium]|nr:hypothetical protein [Anaerolineae bacterium]
MDKKMLKEILAAHADQLLKGNATGNDYLELLPESDDELGPLLDVAERVQSTIKSISPANKEELKRELLTTAHIRKVEGYVPPDPTRDLFYTLVTLAFVVSLGVLLAVLRQREHPI